MRFRLSYILVAVPALAAPLPDDSFAGTQALMNKYCLACHQPKSPAGGFRLETVAADAASLRNEPRRWLALANRVREFEMPPKGAPAPSLEEREGFLKWVETSLRREACSAGPVAGVQVTFTPASGSGSVTGGAATMLQGAADPIILGAVFDIRNGPEAPDMRAGIHVIGIELAANAFIAPQKAR